MNYGSTFVEPKKRILVVDDEAPVRRIVCHTLSRERLGSILEAADGPQAKLLLETQPIDVVITDLSMPGMDGLKLMQWAQQHCPGPTWIILSGRTQFEDAVEAVHLGAFEFIPKPIQSTETLIVAVRNALRQRELLNEQQKLHEEVQQRNERLDEQVKRLRQACHLLCLQSETIEEDFRRAELIQRTLLPCDPPAVQGYALHALYRPSHNVGGDLYDIVRLDERHLVAYVADAAGHGVSAAMLTVLFKHRLPLTCNQPPHPTPPAEVLAAVNDRIGQECHAPGLFVTAAYCLLDTATGRLQIASAGHPPVLICHADGELERIDHTGPALGLSRSARFDQKELTLEPGARLLLFTDGLYDGEVRDIGQRQARIEQLLSRSSLDGQALLHAIWSSAGRNGEQPRNDDATLLLVSAQEAPSTLDNGQSELQDEPVEPPTEPMFAQVLIGQDGDKTTVAIRGRATWAHGVPLHETCMAELEAGHSILIDLAGCEYLDSTLLGTIQEVVTRAAEMGVEVQVQMVSDDVQRLFEELGMRQVLEAVSTAGRPLPARLSPLDASPAADERNRRRIVKAHEGLARLSDANRQQFARLIEGLRCEAAALADDDGSP